MLKEMVRNLFYQAGTHARKHRERSLLMLGYNQALLDHITEWPIEEASTQVSREEIEQTITDLRDQLGI